MDVNQPTSTGAEGANAQAHAAVEPTERFPVGTQASLCPRVFALETGTAQQTKRQLTVHGQCVFCTNVERGTDTCSTAALIALILKVGKLCHLVRILITFLLERIRTTLANLCVMETIELKCLAHVASLHIIRPADEAKVEQSCREAPVVI